VYCLNTGLKLYDSVLVVPTFYGFYTAFGLINSTIYLDQLGDYQPWVLLLVLLGIAVLIYGVRMLSAPKPEQTPSRGQLDGVYDDDDEDAHEMELRSKGSKSGKSGRKNSHKKKRTSRRISLGPGLDEENDGPSIYGSQRGILDGDDTSSEFSTTIGGMGASTVGSTSTRGRGMSFASKSSFQSDPFKTPMDSRSVNDGFVGAGAIPMASGGHRRSVLFGDLNEAPPTHVLVDTTDIDLNEPTDKVYDGHDAKERERERRRQSMLNSSLKTLTQGKLVNTGFDQLPRIDTTSRPRKESERFSSFSAGAMSPSQFKAHLTNTSNQHDAESADQVAAIPRGSNGQGTLSRGHSARWSTGSSKIDQVFEELNPFKVMKNNRDSVGGDMA
ncbi:hypothetical protein BGX21_006332, partial [Mortierella sp. AD011]